MGKELGLIASLKADYTKQILLNDKIEETSTTVTKTGDNITQILHKTGETTIRQDDYTYPDSNTIQEVRTYLAESLQVTITYNLTTLATTVSEITKVVG